MRHQDFEVISYSDIFYSKVYSLKSNYASLQNRKCSKLDLL